MKTLCTLLISTLTLGLTLALCPTVEAATVSKKTVASGTSKVKAKPAAKGLLSAKGKLQTDISFDGSVLHGEYLAPQDALVKVENEKGFSDLIGVRKHFKDRLSVAAEQE